MQRPTVAILGAGSLGEIFALGLLRAGWTADDLVLVSRRQERADELARTTDISSITDLVTGAAGKDVVVISVKPKDVPAVVDTIRESLTADQTVVSLAAGVELAMLEAAMPGQPIVRAMPNTPAAVDLGMTALSPGSKRFERFSELSARRSTSPKIFSTLSRPSQGQALHMCSSSRKL
jgi:pyrroline-5-carboxylate reductase